MELKPINPPERQRTYYFPGGESVVLTMVTGLFVSPSGTHRLKTADGMLHIVPTGWTHIKIDTDDWSF